MHPAIVCMGGALVSLLLWRWVRRRRRAVWPAAYRREHFRPARLSGFVSLGLLAVILGFTVLACVTDGPRAWSQDAQALLTHKLP